jgi:(1->4)-alpha-D-glucan 1-alpha-D-glucosylmutase
MQRRRRHPAALTSTATHDTKRGEDARARIYTISEAPLVWQAAVSRWTEMNRPLRAENDAHPDRDSEWMFYQGLLGAWPAALDLSDASALKALAKRMTAFMIKAAREAKLYTTWTQPDEQFERALTSFVNQALDPKHTETFLMDFNGTVQPFIRAGVVNSLTQLALKLFVPGVPDTYQGTEIWDLSLVDPDNRRPVDFGQNDSLSKAEASPRALLDAWTTGAIKQNVLRAGLRLRRSLGTSFESAKYVPLVLSGSLQRHAVAFARTGRLGTVVVVGTRLSLPLLDGEAPRIAPERWVDTRIHLPAASYEFTDILNGRRHADLGTTLQLADVLRDLPVAVLFSHSNSSDRTIV